MCYRCNNDNGRQIWIEPDIMNNDYGLWIELCGTCLFQLQMSIQIWIDESDKDSTLYEVYGGRTELDDEV